MLETTAIIAGCVAGFVVVWQKPGPGGAFDWLREHAPTQFVRSALSCNRCLPIYVAVALGLLLWLMPAVLPVLAVLAAVGYAYALMGMSGVV